MPQDLLFDAASVYDLSRFEIHIVEAPMPGPLGNSSSNDTAFGPEGRRLIDGAWVRGGTSQAIISGAWTAAGYQAPIDGYDLLPRS